MSQYTRHKTEEAEEAAQKLAKSKFIIPKQRADPFQMTYFETQSLKTRVEKLKMNEIKPDITGDEILIKTSRITTK